MSKANHPAQRSSFAISGEGSYLFTGQGQAVFGCEAIVAESFDYQIKMNAIHRAGPSF